MTQVEINATGLLQSLRHAKKDLASTLAKAESELEAVRLKYQADIQTCEKAVKQAEKALAAFTKKHEVQLFDGRDRAEFKGVGALLMSSGWVVRRAKCVTIELLKKLGYRDGIRVEEKVDWDRINKWPDEKLVAIGTERNLKKEFGWELTGDGHE